MPVTLTDTEASEIRAALERMMDYAADFSFCRSLGFSAWTALRKAETR